MRRRARLAAPASAPHPASAHPPARTVAARSIGPRPGPIGSSVSRPRGAIGSCGAIPIQLVHGVAAGRTAIRGTRGRVRAIRARWTVLGLLDVVPGAVIVFLPASALIAIDVAVAAGIDIAAAGACDTTTAL